MFFEPPKVKSLSRYAEYGAYPGNRYFMIALAIAITAHIAIGVIYSMTPREEIIKIPVRVLNIKFSGGSEANGIYLPKPSSMPNMLTPDADSDAPNSSESMKSITEEDAESTINKALKGHDKKPAAIAKTHAVPPGEGKKVKAKDDAKPDKNWHPSEFSLSTPKKYVREQDTAKSKSAKAEDKTGDGNGSGVAGEAGGKEAINRYTQTISQWIQNHQDYAKAAYKEATEGQNSVKGQAVIRFRITRDGHIVSNSVDHTSGNELLDQIASAMVRASDPVPAVPSDYPSDSQLEFLIPVQVDLSLH